jgi:hypothetical protein
MAAFLITGNPGSGKTAMAGELFRLGYLALDTDDTIAGWEMESGIAVEQPEEPTDGWLLSHRWVWGRERLERAICAQDRQVEHVFFCGIAMNQREMLDLFEVVFLLALDNDTQVARSNTPSNAHRNAAMRAQILEGRPVLEQEMRAAGAVILDGRRPTAARASRILQLVSSLPKI